MSADRLPSCPRVVNLDRREELGVQLLKVRPAAAQDKCLKLPIEICIQSAKDTAEKHVSEKLAESIKMETLGCAI